jgi:hypothetical protein
MSSGPDELLDILKNKTRRKIVILVNEQKTMTYTDLMDALKIANTGRLNYHLKILKDVLTKNADGHYLLTEKGKLVYRLLMEFPGPEKELQTKKKNWKRFWFVAIILEITMLLFSFGLNFWGFIDGAALFSIIFTFPSATIFYYFYYRMLRPRSLEDNKKDPSRTVEEIFVPAKSPEEVKKEVMQWVQNEKIAIELDHGDFIRGRLGNPSGLGLTAPRYFEITIKPEPNGVLVHTEGWVSLFDLRELSFAQRGVITGAVPRRQGWTVMEKLWNRLKKMTT